MKFLFISIIFHLLIILKFFNYQNIQASDKVEPVVSVSLENFNKESHYEKKDFKKYKHHLKKEKIKDTKFFKENEVFNDEINKNEIVKEEIKKEFVEKSLENKNENPQPISKEVTKEVLPQKIADFSGEVKNTTTIVSNPKAELSGSSNTGDGKSVNNISTNNVASSGSSENISSDYIVGNQDVKGLNYKILKAPNPEYPLIAKKANYKNKVVIKVRILVNHLGKVEEIKYFDNETKYGFREEVEKTLKNWKFSDISLDGKPVKMYFFKSFVFQIDN